MSAKSQRYLFETSFDRDRALLSGRDGNPAAASEPEPTFSAADLRQAREAAYAEGEAAGRQDAVESVEKQLLNGLGRMVQQFGVLAEDQARFQHSLTRSSVDLALKAAGKMLPALARREGLVEIEALLRDCLQEARHEPKIVIRVAEAHVEPFRGRIDDLARQAGFEGALVLQGDAALGPADCRIEWSDGGAERIAERMWQEFEAATERIFEDIPDGSADRAADIAVDGDPDGAVDGAAGEIDGSATVSGAMPDRATETDQPTNDAAVTTGTEPIAGVGGDEPGAQR